MPLQGTTKDENGRNAIPTYLVFYFREAVQMRILRCF